MKGLLFTYLMTYGGAVVSLFNPFVGLLIYVCFAILRPMDLWWYSVGPGNYSRVVALGLLAGWLCCGLGNWRLGRARVIVLAGLGFLLWAAVASLDAQVPSVAWNYVEILSKIILPVLVGVTVIDSPKKLRLLAWVIVLSQGYLAYEFNMEYFQGYQRLREEGFGSLDNNGVAVALDTCIGMAFFLGLYAERVWQKGLAFGAMLLMGHAVLFSNSRGGMVGLVCVGVVSFVLIPKRPIYFATFLAMAAVTFRLAGPEVRERFLSSFADEDELDPSAAGRYDLWSSCVDLAIKNPITGVGPDHYPLNAPKYGFVLGKQAHTTVLRIAAETGLPGCLAWSLFFGVCLIRLWPLARGKGPPGTRPLAGMVIPSLVGYLVSSQFVSLELLEVPYYAVMIGAVLLKLQQPDFGESAEAGH